MESIQDETFNTITVLNSEDSNINSGCAVFNGGIYVDKNIISKQLCTNYIETDQLKVFKDLNVKNNISLCGSIKPLNDLSNSNIGSITNKFNELHCVDNLSSNIRTNNLISKNTTTTYFYPNLNNIDLILTTDTSHNLTLNTSYINIDVDFSNENLNLELNIPDPPIGTINNFLRVNLKSNVIATVIWNYNTKTYTINNSCTQILEFYNTDGTWKLIDLTNNNYTDKISSMESNQIKFDSSLNDINSQINFLTETNNFLQINNGENSYNIMEFVNKNADLETDISTLTGQVETLQSNLESDKIDLASLTTRFQEFKTAQESLSLGNSTDFEDLNSNYTTFKSVVNNTFKNINKFMADTSIDIASLKQKDLDLQTEINNLKNNIDLIDKKLNSHIGLSNNKFQIIQEDIKNISCKVNYMYNNSV